tara:strand:- start:1282 stop:1512 length:231 start_codon:yes stop_codon:yes gene_type:complete
MSRHQVLGDTLAEKLGKTWQDVLEGKGGFWIKGLRHYTYKEAYRITGLKPPTQHKDRIVMRAWGDYATIAQINGIK